MTFARAAAAMLLGACGNASSAPDAAVRCESADGGVVTCNGVACAHGEMCRDGACVAFCDPPCERGAACVVQDGGSAACVESACRGVLCQDAQICADGQCRLDPCTFTACDIGRTCCAGVCVVDPCSTGTTVCPDDTECASSCGSATCVPRCPPRVE